MMVTPPTSKGPLDGWRDEDLLALAAREDRILVTFDVNDFPGIVHGWGEAQRQHAGLRTARRFLSVR